MSAQPTESQAGQSLAPEHAAVGVGAELDADGLDLFGVGKRLQRRARLLVVAPLVAGAIALGGSYLIAPTFTARTSFLPPQQQQSASASALSQIGSLIGVAGGLSAIKSPAEQYIALLQSVTVTDRIVDRFGLMQAYAAKYRFEARRELAENVRIALGKKDGLISVEVDDHSPQRAADMANQYVAELRRLTGELALTEAQQRRMFFEAQLKGTRDRLTLAQQALQSSGFNAGALKAEPRAAADAYARLSAEITAGEVRLQALRRALADNAPEVQQQLAILQALRGQLLKAEAANSQVGRGGDVDYIGKYREYKYQETLFETFARQFELAKLDESREGALIQVVDAAQVPEWKSRPKRAFITLAAIAAALLAAGIYAIVDRPRQQPPRPADHGR